MLFLPAHSPPCGIPSTRGCLALMLCLHIFHTVPTIGVIASSTTPFPNVPAACVASSALAALFSPALAAGIRVASRPVLSRFYLPLSLCPSPHPFPPALHRIRRTTPLPPRIQPYPPFHPNIRPM